jgi:hypothetical protein
MTICDNFPEGMSGTSYCTHSPNYSCFKDGWPSCCRENALNCPREQPSCDYKMNSNEVLASKRFLRKAN